MVSRDIFSGLEVDALLLELLEYAVPKGKKPRTRGEVLVKYAKMVIREGMTECKDAQHIKKILD